MHARTHKKKFTNHKGSRPLRSRHHVVWDPQSEGFVVVLIRVFFPPDLKLPNRAPAC